MWDKIKQTGQGESVSVAAASAVPATEAPTQPIGNGNRGRKAKVKVEQKAAAGQEAADGTGVPDLCERERRYLALVPPAASWLAVEVTRRSILANEASSAFYWRWLTGYLSGQHKLSSRDYKRRHHTLLTSYVGYLYLVCIWSARQRYDRFPTFYRQAVDQFQQASILTEKWYKPYENLGDTWTMWGLQSMVQAQPGTTAKVLTDQPPDSSKTHFYQALDAYSEAWRRFHTHNDVYRQPVVRRNGAAIPDDATIERRLNLGICTTLLPCALAHPTSLLFSARTATRRS